MLKYRSPELWQKDSQECLSVQVVQLGPSLQGHQVHPVIIETQRPLVWLIQESSFWNANLSLKLKRASTFYRLLDAGQKHSITDYVPWTVPGGGTGKDLANQNMLSIHVAKPQRPLFNTTPIVIKNYKWKKKVEFENIYINGSRTYSGILPAWSTCW